MASKRRNMFHKNKKQETTEIGTSCDVTVNSDSNKEGSVTSPGYPGPYPPRTHCRYHFVARGKERVQITFTDFALYHGIPEAQDAANDCDGVDSVIAYVQIEGKLDKIDSYCGLKLPSPIMSNGPRLELEFRGIHSSRHSRGFRAAYFFTENFGIGSGEQMSDYPCAFRYRSEESHPGGGTFSSPNFPGLYPRDTECHYFFHGANYQRVRIHFHYFDVEGVLPCDAVSASDYVEFSNFMALDRKYSRHCGQLKSFDVESDRKFFRVTFRSNDRLDATGFNATYRFIPEDDFMPIPVTPLQPSVVASGNPASLITDLWGWLMFLVLIK